MYPISSQALIADTLEVRSALTAASRCESPSRFFDEILYRVDLKRESGNDAILASALVLELLDADEVARFGAYRSRHKRIVFA